MRRERFQPNGLLALDASAYGAVFDVYAPADVAPQASTDPAVVTVRGPLLNHRDWCFDSYEAIKERVRLALASSAPCVVLDIDSPGGLVSGCFETGRELRAMARAAGKPLYAYAANATSAAYALACAADQVFASETSRLGSIGVIETIVDATRQDAALGLKVELVVSGARKADGNPHAEISPAALAAAQSSVDSAAAIFYGYVGEMRGLEPAAVASLEAGVFLGAQAVSLRLADSLSTLDNVIATVAEPGYVALTSENNTMAAGTVSAAIEALTKAAESDDKDERANARRMLAKYYAEDSNDSVDDKTDDDNGDGKSDKKAEASDDSKEEEKPVTDKKDDDKKEAKSSATDAGAQALAVANEAKAIAESTERARLIASRPDFSPEFAKALALSPLAEVRRFVESVPAGKAPVRSTVKDAQAALASTAPVRAEGSTEASAPGRYIEADGRPSTYTLVDLERQMGLRAQNTEMQITYDNRAAVPVLTPEQARKRLEALNAAQKGSK